MIPPPTKICWTIEEQRSEFTLTNNRYVERDYRAVIYDADTDRILEKGNWFKDRGEAIHDAEHRAEEERWVYGFREDRPKYSNYLKP